MSREKQTDSSLLGESTVGDGLHWALILGGSKGLGLATARKLAHHGYHIIIVHRDRKLDLPQIENDFKEIALCGVTLRSFNVDAVNSQKRTELLKEIKKILSPDQRIKILVHSIAKGNLKPMHSEHTLELTQQDFQLTLNAMAISLYDWTKSLIAAGLFALDARVISFTSEGNVKALPNYGAVSVAKVALEAITRNMALEFAPLGIKANCIQAGVTETASFHLIPESDKIMENAIKRNPNKRLTRPEDVANVVYLLCREEAKWITGTVIKVDGGESLR